MRKNPWYDRPTSNICSGCHKRPKAKSNNYCLECQREYRRLHPRKERKNYKRVSPFPPLCGKCKLRPHRKGHAWCKECANEANRKWKLNKGSWKHMTLDQRQKAVARRYVKTRVDRGHMKKLPCAVCGNPDVQAHHHKGYSKEHALDVVWLCYPHHLEAELKMFVDGNSALT